MSSEGLAARLRLPTPLVAFLALVLVILVVPPAIFLIDVSFHESKPDGSMGAFKIGRAHV